MKRNIHTVDAIVRVLVAVLVAVLYFTNMITGTLAIILGVVAVVFASTAFINFCPLYAILGISTFRRKVS